MCRAKTNAMPAYRVVRRQELGLWLAEAARGKPLSIDPASRRTADALRTLAVRPRRVRVERHRTARNRAAIDFRGVANRHVFGHLGGQTALGGSGGEALLFDSDCGVVGAARLVEVVVEGLSIKSQ